MTWDQYFMLVRFMIAFNICVFVFVSYMEWWRKRGRIQVRIKTPLGEKKKWVKPENDGKTLIIEKESKKRPEWKASFTNKSIVFFGRWFGRIGRAVDVFYHAKKCIDYDYTLSEADQPKFDKKASKGYIEAKVLKEMGKGEKMEIPFIFWVLLIMSFVNLALMFMIGNRLGVL